MSDGLKLISRLLADGSSSALRDLDESLFRDDELRQYQFVTTHWRSHGVLPQAITVTDGTGIRLPNAPEPIGHYLAQLVNRKKYNWVRDHFTELKDCMARQDMEQAGAIFSEGTRVLRGGVTGQTIKNIAEAGEEMIEVVEQRRLAGGGIPSGWPTFDRITGGYLPGNLYTWVARTGIGKSWGALYQAHHAWSVGCSVMVVTFEMSIEEIMQRNMAFMAHVNPRGLQSGRVSTQALSRVQAVVRDIVGATRYHILGDDLTPKIGSVVSYIQEYRPDIVFIDGAQFIRPDGGKYSSRLERVNDVWDELKSVTTKHRIPVVVNAQFNRLSGKDGKDGGLDTVGVTDLISQHSSVATKMYPANEIKDKLVMEMLKHRHGPIAEFEINYKFSPPNLSEVSSSDWESAEHEEELQEQPDH